MDCSCSLLLLFSKADDIVTSDRWLHRMWAPSESNGQLMSHRRQEQELPTVADDCNTKTVYIFIYNKKNSEPHFFFFESYILYLNFHRFTLVYFYLFGIGF